MDQQAMYAVVEKKACVGCGCCDGSCAVKAIVVEDLAEIDAELCTGCGQCEALCPAGAITLKCRG